MTQKQLEEDRLDDESALESEEEEARSETEGGAEDAEDDLPEDADEEGQTKDEQTEEELEEDVTTPTAKPPVQTAPQPRAPAPGAPYSNSPNFAHSPPYGGPHYSFEEARQNMQQATPGAPPLLMAGQSPDPASMPGFGPYPAFPSPQQLAAAQQGAQVYPSMPQVNVQPVVVQQPQQPEPHVDYVFGPMAAEAGMHQPLLDKKETKLYVEVHREKLGKGSEGDEGTGYLGSVENTRDWLDKIKERFGGGTYKVKGLYMGKAFERGDIKIPGPSLTGDEEEDEEGEGGFGRPAGGPVNVYSDRRPVGGPPWTGGGYPRDPRFPAYGRESYPPPHDPRFPPRYGAGRPDWSAMGGRPYPGGQQDESLREELEEMRAELQAARDLAAQEREERRIEQERAERKLQEERFQQTIQAQNEKFERLMEKVNNPQQGAFDKMLQLMTLQQQQEQQRREREREEEKRAAERERERAREEEKRRERERKHEQDKSDKQREVEIQRAMTQSERQEKFFQRMFEFSQSQQQKPDDFLKLLASMQQLNPQKDPTDAMVAMVGAFAQMQDVFGGGGGSSTAEKIVDKVVDGATTLAEAWQKGGNQQPQVDPAHMLTAQQAAVQQPMALPGPGAMTPQQMQSIAAYQARAAQHAQAMEQDAQARAELIEKASRPPTEDEWGMLLKHVIALYTEEREPVEAVLAIHGYVINELGVPKTLEILEDATPGIMRIKLPAIKAEIPVASEHYRDVELFEQYLLNDDEGVEWLGQVLDGMRAHQAAIREAAYQNQQAEQHGQVVRAHPHAGQPLPPQQFGFQGPGYQQQQSAWQGMPQGPQGIPMQQPMPARPSGGPQLPPPPADLPGQPWFQGQPVPPGYGLMRTPWGPRLMPIDPRVAAADLQNQGWQPNMGADPSESQENPDA